MKGRGEPWNLDDFAAASRGILQTGQEISQNFPQETVGPIHHDNRTWFRGLMTERLGN